MVRKVLICDDEPNIVIALEFLLRQNGYETRVAEDGEQALREVDRFAPDVVLLDVMLTAKGRESEIAKGLALGADAYVTKPFSTRDLVQQVGTMFDGTP